MAEPTVQVPVSLIERAHAMIDTRRLDAAEVLDALAALLSQPTAEPCCSRPGDPNWHTADGGHVVPPDVEEDTPVAPPSIADMAPGTEFLCEGKGVSGVEHHMRVTEDVYRDGARILWCLTHEFGATSTYVDPSTIRDITPPKE